MKLAQAIARLGESEVQEFAGTEQVGYQRPLYALNGIYGTLLT